MGPIWRNLHEAWVLLFVQSTWPFDLRRSLNTARGTHTENSQRHYQSVPKKGPGAAQSWVHIIRGTVVSICLSFSMREMMIKIELRLGWLEATPVTYLFRVRNFSRELGLSQKGCYPKRCHGHPWPNLVEGWNMTINHQLVFSPTYSIKPISKTKDDRTRIHQSLSFCPNWPLPVQPKAAGSDMCQGA